MRRAAARTSGLGAGEPAAHAFGRFRDLAEVDESARRLGADLCAWHRLYLAAQAPEGVERALLHLVATGDRGCALRAVHLLARGLRECGAHAPLARARYWLGALAAPGPGSERALRRLRQALAAAVAHGEGERAARVLGQIGRHLLVLGRTAEAYSRLEAALALAGAEGRQDDTVLPPVVRAGLWANLGLSLARLGHLERAGAAYRRAFDLAQAAGREDAAMHARDGLRFVAEQRGHLEEAFLHAQAVLAWRRRVGPPVMTQRALVTLARIAHDLDPPGDAALALLDEAAALPADAGDRAARLMCQALVHADREEDAASRAALALAEAELARMAEPVRSTAAFHLAYLHAHLLWARGEVAGAYEWYRQAAAVLAAEGVRRLDVPAHQRAGLMADMAAAAQGVGRTEEAARMAVEMERAWRPEPLPDASPAAVVRGELAALPGREEARRAARVVILPTPGRRAGR